MAQKKTATNWRYKILNLCSPQLEKGHRFNQRCNKGMTHRKGRYPPTRIPSNRRKNQGLIGCHLRLHQSTGPNQPNLNQFGLHNVLVDFQGIFRCWNTMFSTGVSAIFSPGSPSYIKVTVMRQNHGTSIEYLSSLSVLRLSLCHFSYIPKNTNMDPGK